jgi:LuxR family transcriptional regulator, maltose regulon positive regulatory protein
MPQAPTPAVGAPLLSTKLFLPRPRPGLVARPQLAQMLDAAATSPLTLVSAPAGFGKTTLVAAWAQQQPLPAGWLSLDAGDNDPNRFLAYLIAALQSADPDAARDLHAALAGGQAPPIEAAAAMLINDLARLPHDILLVLDDFHVIDEPWIEGALATLVAHQPPQLHLLIATREDPPLPLARMRAQGGLVELRAQELRFSPDETAAFLNQGMGLALTPQQAADLDARIEGWIAGLQLAGLSLQKSSNAGALIAGLTSSHHFILTYLTEEVLRQQPPAVQDFLLQTSVLQRLTGSLCDAVRDQAGSPELLDALYAANVFLIPLDAEHTWFRYHHLFRDLLQSQLQRTQVDLIPTLHRRASTWYARHAEPAAAIDHALAAGDYADAVVLLETHARPLVLGGYAQTVAGWLQRLPPEWQAAGPNANVAFAWSLLLRGQLDEIERYLRNAEAGLGGTGAGRAGESDASVGDACGPSASSPSASGPGALHPAVGGRDGLRAEILGLRAGVVSLGGETERACAMAREAVALAPADDTYVQGATRFCLATACNYAGRTVEAIAAYREALPLCRSAGNALAAMLSVANLSLLLFERGELQDAAGLCRRVIAEAEQVGSLHSPAVASVRGALAHVLYEWNELEEARLEAQAALELGQRSGHAAAVAYGSIVLSRIEAARGEPAAAAQLVEQARGLRGRSMPAWVAPYIVSQQVALALACGDEQAAQRALDASGVAVDAPTDHTREVIHLAYLPLLLYRLANRLPARRPAPADGELAAATLALAGRVAASAETGGRLGRTIEALSVRALALQAQGKQGAAQADLRRALQLAAPSGYLRLFIELGAAMPPLLAEYNPPPEQAAYTARLRSILGAVYGRGPEPAAQPDQSALVEPLSARELEVLHLMAQGLTYQEAAEQLIVSLNTVRFHVKTIYGKLGVDNRTAALEKARSMDLL